MSFGSVCALSSESVQCISVILNIRQIFVLNYMHMSCIFSYPLPSNLHISLIDNVRR